MEGATGAPQLAAQLDQRGDVEERARIDRLRNAHDVLRHDAAGAEVQVPDFAVADLPFGESHGEVGHLDRKSTRLNSSHLVISYAVFCLKKKKQSEYAIVLAH